MASQSHGSRFELDTYALPYARHGYTFETPVPPDHETCFGLLNITLKMEARAREEPTADRIHLGFEFTEINDLTHLKRVSARVTNQKFEDIVASWQTQHFEVHGVRSSSRYPVGLRCHGKDSQSFRARLLWRVKENRARSVQR